MSVILETPALARWLPDTPPGVPGDWWERSLAGPLREMLGRPGKNFRSRLVGHAWELAGGVGEVPAELPAAVELLHAGSLIIDDIQDGAAERRGGPALHRLIGVPLAINAGNWLYFRALDLLDGDDLRGLASRAVLRCHDGQAVDLSARIDGVVPADVPALALAISERKTGSLMSLAASLGAKAAAPCGPACEALGRFGVRLGVALQMLNDLADLAEDIPLRRVTWPWAWLADSLPPADFRRLQRDPPTPEGVRYLLGGLPARRVRGWLDAAVASVEEHLPESPALDRLRGEVSRLETTYG